MYISVCTLFYLLTSFTLDTSHEHIIGLTDDDPMFVGL